MLGLRHSGMPPVWQQVVLFPMSVQLELFTQAQLLPLLPPHRGVLLPALIQHGRFCGQTPLLFWQRQFPVGLLGSQGASHRPLSLQMKPVQQVLWLPAPPVHVAFAPPHGTHPGDVVSVTLQLPIVSHRTQVPQVVPDAAKA